MITLTDLSMLVFLSQLLPLLLLHVLFHLHFKKRNRYFHFCFSATWQEWSCVRSAVLGQDSRVECGVLNDVRGFVPPLLILFLLLICTDSASPAPFSVLPVAPVSLCSGEQSVRVPPQIRKKEENSYPFQMCEL